MANVKPTSHVVFLATKGTESVPTRHEAEVIGTITRADLAAELKRMGFNLIRLLEVREPA